MIWSPDHVKSFSLPLTFRLIWRISSDQSPQEAQQVSRCCSARGNLPNLMGENEISFDWHLHLPKNIPPTHRSLEGTRQALGPSSPCCLSPAVRRSNRPCGH